jgi:hypothetical protein
VYSKSVEGEYPNKDETIRKVLVMSKEIVAALREYQALEKEIRALEKQIDAYRERQRQLQRENHEKIKAMCWDPYGKKPGYQFVMIDGQLYKVNFDCYMFPLRYVPCLDLPCSDFVTEE